MMIYHTLLDSVAKLYDISPSELVPLAGGHFAHVYEYPGVHQACILRITPPDPDVDLIAMRATLEWLAFLSAHDGPVPRPVRSRNGNLFELVKHEGAVYIASTFEKAPGVLAERILPAGWSDELFQALGRALGLWHRVAQVYVPLRAEFKRPEWDWGTNCFHPKEELVGADPTILEKRDRVLSALRSLPKDRDSYGLAHLDLHFGNFFVDTVQQRITLFDFDDCGYGWYAMDIAMLLFDVLVVYDGFDRQQFGERFLKNLLRGYRTQVAISEFWLSQLPHFVKLLEIGVYVMLYRGYDAATADEWVSKFIPGRRDRIEQEMPYVALDFQAL